MEEFPELSRLCRLVLNGSRHNGQQQPLVLVLNANYSDYGLWQPFGALLEVQTLFQIGHRCPVIILGLPEREWVRGVACKMLPHGSQAWRVLEWPGLVYLRYGELPEALDDACESIFKGSALPLPDDLISDTGPLSMALSQLRHLLVHNRKKSLSGRKADFIRACKNGEELSRFHLIPTPPFESAGEKMLERLWGLDDVARISSLTTRGLASLKESIKYFILCWVEYEEKKHSIIESDKLEARNISIHLAIEKMEGVDSALAAVASEIDILQRNLGIERDEHDE